MKKLVLTLGSIALLSAGVANAAQPDSYVRGSLGYGFGATYGKTIDADLGLGKQATLSGEVDLGFAPFGNGFNMISGGGGVRLTYDFTDKFFGSLKVGAAVHKFTYKDESYGVDYTGFGVGTSGSLGYKIKDNLSVGVEGGYSGAAVGGFFVKYGL